MKQRVLLIEDDENLSAALRQKFEREGMDVVGTDSGREALDLFERYAPDLVVLDLVLPDISGFEVCEELKQKSDTPVLILSVMARESDKLEGLARGADDYVTKPFSLRELVVRSERLLKARLEAPAPIRQAAAEPAPAGPVPAGRRRVLEVGDLTIDLRTHEVTVGGRRVHPPPTQVNVLRILTEHARRVVSPAALLARAWPSGTADYSELAEAIMGLRSAIEEDPVHPERIVYVPGYGYKLMPIEHGESGSNRGDLPAPQAEA